MRDLDKSANRPINRVNRFFLWIVWLAFGIISNDREVRAEAAYDPHGKRDPFTPLVTMTSKESSGLLGAESPDELTIEGIVYDPKKGSVIVVNGSVLKEGEEVGKMKVVKIRPDGALILFNGSEVYKSMYEERREGQQGETV